MTRTLYTILIGFAILSLTGCGGGIPPTSSTTTSILSAPALDGDIWKTSPNSFTITQGMSSSVQSVVAGVDPVGRTEYRAFLAFPLGGNAGIPFNAFIDSAFLSIHIKSIQPNPGTIPILIELVSFEPPTLRATDYDRSLLPPLAFTRILPPISSVDVGSNISIDVTSLMVEAQFKGLSYFQVRILEDFGTSPGLIEINNTTGINRPSLAPLLTVTYH